MTILRLSLRSFALLTVLLSGALLMAGSPPGVEAADAVKFYTLYLTENRACEDCTWRWVKVKGADRVELINKRGDSEVVRPEEIIGVDNHPAMRRFMMKSLAGIGLPGPIIVPDAFENGREFTCKYCEK